MLKNEKVVVGQNLSVIPIFSKLINFGLHILTFLEILGKGYKPPKFSELKHRNKKVIG